MVKRGGKELHKHRWDFTILYKFIIVCLIYVHVIVSEINDTIHDYFHRHFEYLSKCSMMIGLGGSIFWIEGTNPHRMQVVCFSCASP